MRKLLSWIFILCISLIPTQSIFASSNVDNAMNNFYAKIDRSYSDIEQRIEKLEEINEKIKSIKSKKWDKLSNKSQILVSSIESSIHNKIRLYKKEIENKKEDISISDILGDVDSSPSTNDQEGEKEKVYFRIFLSNENPKVGESYDLGFSAYNSPTGGVNKNFMGKVEISINGSKSHFTFDHSDKGNRLFKDWMVFHYAGKNEIKIKTLGEYEGEYTKTIYVNK